MWKVGKAGLESCALGENAYPYSSSTSILIFSVGALVSILWYFGDCHLIAPNLVITAAHVLKNSFRNLCLVLKTENSSIFRL